MCLRFVCSAARNSNSLWSPMSLSSEARDRQSSSLSQLSAEDRLLNISTFPFFLWETSSLLLLLMEEMGEPLMAVSSSLLAAVWLLLPLQFSLTAMRKYSKSC